MDTIKRFLEAFRASETNARRFPREGAGQRERSRISVSHVLKWVQRRRRWKRGRPTLRHHETHISGNRYGTVSALTAFWMFSIYAVNWWPVTNALTHPGSATCGMSLTTYDTTHTSDSIQFYFILPFNFHAIQNELHTKCNLYWTKNNSKIFFCDPISIL